MIACRRAIRIAYNSRNTLSVHDALVRVNLFIEIKMKCWSSASDVDITNKKHSNTDSETVFADVIKNISRVNDVLQELITNYKHLQKLYNSQEDIGSDSDSDDEASDKKKSHTKSNQNERSMQETSTIKANKNRPATPIIWSDANNDDDSTNDDDASSDSSSETNENELTKSTTPQTPKIESWLMGEKEKKPFANFIAFRNENYQLKKDNINSNKVPNVSDNSQNVKTVFHDTQKKLSHKSGSKPTVFPELKIGDVTMKIKSVFNVKEHTYPVNHKDNDLHPNSFLRQGPNSVNSSKHDIKNIVYGERFPSKNIWDQIANHKPIQLKEEKVAANDDDMHRTFNESDANLRSNKDKNALVLITDINTKKPLKESKSDLSDEEGAINKDMFKTSILRKAYGDACLKLVVRKCYKACKVAGKRTCMRFKCKSRFKEIFKENSKIACIKYFRGNEKTNKTMNYRGGPNAGGEDFTDVTRGGYLAAACWPYASEPLLAARNSTPLSVSPVSPDKELNVLRDRYERACQKVSTGQCVHACKYSYTTSCAGYDCSARMKKSFKKDCKSQCKIMYSDEKKTKSASSDDSDDSSDDSSDGSDSGDSSGSSDSI